MKYGLTKFYALKALLCFGGALTCIAMGQPSDVLMLVSGLSLIAMLTFGYFGE